MSSAKDKLRLWKSKIPNGFWEFFRIDKAFRWERLNNDVSRGVVIFFRFITVWAFGLVAFSGPTTGSFYTIIHNNSTTLALPNASRANWSLEATWVVGIWEFTWQIVGGLLQFLVPGHMLLLIPDGISLGLVSACYAQSGMYIPSNETCIVNASIWQTSPSGMNLFTAIGQVKNQTADSVCYDFVGIEQTQLTFIATLGIMVGIGIFSLLPESHPLHFWKLILYALLPLYLIISETVIHLSMLRHYLGVKLSEERAADMAEKEGYIHELNDLSGYVKPLPPRDYKSQRPALEQVLGIEHIFQEICLDLCYRDVIRLSRTSRAIHDLVLPPQDLHVRMKKLRTWTCMHNGDNSPLNTCFICNRRTCSACQHTPGIDEQQLSHLTRCKPACTWCYYKRIIRDRKNVGRRRCAQWHVSPSLNTTMNVCSVCLDDAGPSWSEDTPSLQDQVKARVRAQAREKAEEQQCKFCGSKFGWITRRWWSCNICGKECRDAMHPHHLPRPRRKDKQGVIVDEVEEV